MSFITTSYIRIVGSLVKGGIKLSQESIKINNMFLKSLRSLQELTQEKLAEQVGIAHRQYQRIERDGNTTIETANKLAKELQITTGELQNPTGDPGLWFVSSSLDNKIRIERNVQVVIYEIRKRLRQYTSDPTTKTYLSLVNDEYSKIAISLSYENFEAKWLFRPVKLKESQGLIWSEMTEWQKFILLEKVDEITNSITSQLIIENNLTFSLSEEE
tara:strand:- start:5372 stop:6019 length:648 start_codon:yes stop_codon:yes gene_type:complete